MVILGIPRIPLDRPIGGPCRYLQLPLLIPLENIQVPGSGILGSSTDLDRFQVKFGIQHPNKKVFETTIKGTGVVGNKGDAQGRAKKNWGLG